MPTVLLILQGAELVAAFSVGERLGDVPDWRTACLYAGIAGFDAPKFTWIVTDTSQIMMDLWRV